MSTLLLINRQGLLTDTKLRLPFWYSIRIIFSIISVFKNLGKKRLKKKSKPALADNLNTPPLEEIASPAPALKSAAQTYLNNHIPEGHTPESYLEEMESRWQKILPGDARNQMVKDIRITIKKRMNKMVEFWGVRQINANTISDIADTIIQETPALQGLDTEDAVHSYVSLYLSFLLKNPKYSA
jgi:hypothetical protein